MPVISCAVCGRPVRVKPSHAHKRKVCSRQCQAELFRTSQMGANNPNWRGGPVVGHCLRCGQSCSLIPARARKFKYCSQACKTAYESEAKRGENSPKWRGGAAASKARYRAKFPKRRPAAVAPSRPCKACGRPGVKKGRTYHEGCRPFVSAKLTFACVDCGVERSGHRRPGREPPARCKRCGFKARKGSGNGNWKGGITPHNRRVRASDEYKAWRKAVFERDGYTCVWCGQVGYELHADHIKPFATHPDLRFEVSNGRTLCVECHKKTDSYLSRGKKLAAAAKRIIGELEGML